MVIFISRTPSRFIPDENGVMKSVDVVEIRCKSTDVKPTQGIASGSTCLEEDTRNVFFFDEDTGQWI